MAKRKPLTDEDGEVRELTLEDFKRFRPVAEVLPQSLLAKLAAHRRGLQNAPTKERTTILVKEAKLTTLDVQARLEYARAGVAALRALQIRDEKNAL